MVSRILHAALPFGLAAASYGAGAGDQRRSIRFEVIASSGY